MWYYWIFKNDINTFSFKFGKQILFYFYFFYLQIFMLISIKKQILFLFTNFLLFTIFMLISIKN